MFCNAGHDNPIIINSGRDLKHINTGGLLMGAFPENTYEENELKLNSGDALIVYSDGITEAMNENEEEFTLERLEEIIRINVKLSANELHNIIYKEVKTHSKNVVQSDDITLLIVKKL